MAAAPHLLAPWLLSFIAAATAGSYSFPSSYLSSMTGGDGGMTWMGWAPQTGMTAFASSSNPWTAGRGWSTGDGPESPVQEGEASEQQPLDHPPKKWNRPRYDDDEEDRPGASSKAEASLNAWFPIMLGLFPPGETGDDEHRRGSHSPADKAKSIAAVANSVNHGSRGVASSHAVAFGGEPPSYRTRLVSDHGSGRTTDHGPGSGRDSAAPASAEPAPPGPALRYRAPLKRYASTHSYRPSSFS